MANQNGMDVPCGECNACCRSSQFIHIGPEETVTLAHIPDQLLFKAPGRTAGHVLMGYDENGHCPMLVDGKCSIYPHRPLTCRNYDCRIFPAAGLAPREDGKALISQRTQQWKFSYPEEQDRRKQTAVLTAELFLRENPDCVPTGMAGNSTQLALFAIKISDVFLKYNDEYNKTGRVLKNPEVILAVLDAGKESGKLPQ